MTSAIMWRPSCRRRDFDRLDPRFRLPTSLAQLHDEYADWGFAVFQLKPGQRPGRAPTPQAIQPMAFTFPRAGPRRSFSDAAHP